MRTKIYHITPQGREIADDKIDRFVKDAYNFITLIDSKSMHRSICDIDNDPVTDLRLVLDPV